MMKKILLIYIPILIAAIFIRAYHLDKVPPHLSNDEISIAYDAYSIARTGRDEHNNFLPVSFQSHGTYKAPLYHYLLAPLTLILQNNDITAKLPSLIAGVLTVIVIGLLSYEITNNVFIGIISSLVLTFTPWAIIPSRMVLESNLALFFLTSGLWLFLRYLNNQKNSNIYLFFSCLSLSLSLYGYHTEWGLVPMVIVFLLINYFRERKKTAFVFLIFFLILISPLINDFYLRLGTSARANSEIIINEARIHFLLAQQKYLPVKLLIILKVFINNYLAYLNPVYLFVTGLDILPRFNPYPLGLFLWPLVIPFFTGLLKLKTAIIQKHLWFFIFWFLASPIVPALTHGGENFVRNLPAVIPYTITIAIGIQILIKKNLKLSLIISGLSLITFIYFEAIYIFHYPLQKADTFQEYKSIAAYLKPIESNYIKIIVDERFGLDNQYVGVPHLYFAYYNYFDPLFLQKRIYDKYGTYYDNYYVTHINWDLEKIEVGSLYIVPRDNMPNAVVNNNLKLIKEFTNEAGIVSFKIFEGI
jgi:4-amino-4-deoxy-L-arabinose transferase-like glycosyltransferase